MQQDSVALCQIRAYLQGPLEVERRAANGSWNLVREEWGKGKPARSVFRRLLAAPGRRLSRGRLQEDLWPDIDFELADKYLYNAMSIIRTVIGKELVSTSEAGYELASQSLLWIDMDACQELLKEAENFGISSLQSLPLLEQVLGYLERGEFLEGESGAWCYGVRKRSENMLRQCRLWLAESYETQDKLWQAGEQYRALLQTFLPDEDALRAWIEMLHRHGKLQDALRCYQETKDSAEASGFTLSPAIEQFVASLKKSLTLTLFSPTPSAFENDILLSKIGEQSVNYSRRQMLQAIAMACTTLTLSPYGLLQPEKRERLLASIQHPLYLHETVLDDFQEITRRYWRLSANASLQLLQGLFGLFQDVMQILNASQSPAVSEGLYSLASEVAQLLAKTLADLRDYPLALSYYSFALKAAREAHRHDLWAAGAGRMSLTLLSSKQPQKALVLLEEAQDIPLQSQMLRSWHAVIEAEAYSHLGNPSACRNALTRAKDTAEVAFLEADIYATGFTGARLASYEGSCYLRLGQPENALPVLEEARNLINPAAVRRLSRLLTYLGEAHVALGDARQAFSYACQAVDLTRQTQSLDILCHVQTLQERLLARGEMFYAKDLSGQIEETHVMIRNAGRGIS